MGLKRQDSLIDVVSTYLTNILKILFIIRNSSSFFPKWTFFSTTWNEGWLLDIKVFIVFLVLSLQEPSWFRTSFAAYSVGSRCSSWRCRSDSSCRLAVSAPGSSVLSSKVSIAGCKMVKAHSHGAITTAIGCMGFVIVAIAPCEHLQWNPYNPFVATKITVAIASCEYSLRIRSHWAIAYIAEVSAHCIANTDAIARKCEREYFPHRLGYRAMWTNLKGLFRNFKFKCTL